MEHTSSDRRAPVEYGDDCRSCVAAGVRAHVEYSNDHDDGARDDGSDGDRGSGTPLYGSPRSTLSPIGVSTDHTDVRLVVFDCHHTLWTHHTEGTFTADQRRAANEWFYDVGWTRDFVMACRARNIGIGVATMLHDMHDGIDPAVLRGLVAGAYYDTTTLVRLEHDYERFVGGRRLVRDVFATHLGVDLLPGMIEAWMPRRGTPQNKCEHLARLVAAHNNLHAAPDRRITSMHQVWFFDDNIHNTAAASCQGYTVANVPPTHGFGRRWLHGVLHAPHPWDTSVSARDIAQLLATLGLDGAMDAFGDALAAALANSDSDDNEEGFVTLEMAKCTLAGK